MFIEPLGSSHFYHKFGNCLCLFVPKVGNCTTRFVGILVSLYLQCSLSVFLKEILSARGKIIPKPIGCQPGQEVNIGLIGTLPSLILGHPVGLVS